MVRVSINHRILRCDSQEIEDSAEPAMNLSDTVFEFLSDESDGPSPASLNDVFDVDDDDDDDKENGNENGNGNVEDNFWETQHQLLQETICRTSSLESRIRKIVKETIKEAQNSCSCGKPRDDGCRKCLMVEVSRRLRLAGLDSAICKSKWRSSSDIPSGEHTFIDVLDNSNAKRETRVIVELKFRAEFEMARSNEEYNKLVKKLPEIFVGKIERLMALLKILCAAAKKCMAAKKMHLGPWRKYRYMQAKYLRTVERLASSRPLSSGNTSRIARPKLSMLTVDLMESLSNLHMVEVV